LIQVAPIACLVGNALSAQSVVARRETRASITTANSALVVVVDTEGFAVTTNARQVGRVAQTTLVQSVVAVRYTSAIESKLAVIASKSRRTVANTTSACSSVETASQEIARFASVQVIASGVDECARASCGVA